MKSEYLTMPTEIKNLTTFGAILNGGVASFCNISITHPLFTLKTRRMSPGALPPLKQSLYYGYSANLCCDMSCQIVNFIAFNFFSTSIMKSKELTDKERCVGGLFSGFLATPLVSSFERVMILKQQGLVDPLTKKRFDNRGIVSYILKIEGLRGLVKGFTPTCGRECVNSVCFFGLQKILEKKIKVVTGNDEVSIGLSFFTAGALSGGITAHFDLAKTRMQLALGENMSYMKTIKKIIREEGVSTLMTLGAKERMVTIAFTSFVLGPISIFVREILPNHPLVQNREPVIK